jgi:hypothetical protein
MSTAAAAAAAAAPPAPSSSTASPSTAAPPPLPAADDGTVMQPLAQAVLDPDLVSLLQTTSSDLLGIAALASWDGSATTVAQLLTNLQAYIAALNAGATQANAKSLGVLLMTSQLGPTPDKLSDPADLYEAATATAYVLIGDQIGRLFGDTVAADGTRALSSAMTVFVKAQLAKVFSAVTDPTFVASLDAGLEMSDFLFAMAEHMTSSVGSTVDPDGAWMFPVEVGALIGALCYPALQVLWVKRCMGRDFYNHRYGGLLVVNVKFDLLASLQMLATQPGAVDPAQLPGLLAALQAGEVQLTLQVRQQDQADMGPDVMLQMYSKVAALSDWTRQTSDAVAQTSSDFSLRKARIQAMLSNLELADAAMKAQRAAFWAWVVAYVAAVGVAVALVCLRQHATFMLFAASVMALVVTIALVRVLVAWLGGKKKSALLATSSL